MGCSTWTGSLHRGTFVWVGSVVVCANRHQLDSSLKREEMFTIAEIIMLTEAIISRKASCISIARLRVLDVIATNSSRTCKNAADCRDR